MTGKPKTWPVLAGEREAFERQAVRLSLAAVMDVGQMPYRTTIPAVFIELADPDVLDWVAELATLIATELRGQGE